MEQMIDQMIIGLKQIFPEHWRTFMEMEIEYTRAKLKLVHDLGYEDKVGWEEGIKLIEQKLNE